VSERLQVLFQVVGAGLGRFDECPGGQSFLFPEYGAAQSFNWLDTFDFEAGSDGPIVLGQAT
jgi:hypothetical protein